jgi:hypothetical protein
VSTLNISEADRINQTTVARSILNASIRHCGRLMRFVNTYGDTHRIDFRMDRGEQATWKPLYFFEVKCRLKKYDPFKISREKIEEGFAIAQRAKLPFWLWVWFSTEDFARGVLIDDLNLPSSGVYHGSRPGNGEASFDFKLNRFTHEVPIQGTYQCSPNSNR